MRAVFSRLLFWAAVYTFGSAPLAQTTTITVSFPYSGHVSPYANVQMARYSSLDSLMIRALDPSQRKSVPCEGLTGFGLGTPYSGIRVGLGEASVQAWQGYLKLGGFCYVDSGRVLERALVQAALKGIFFVDGVPASSEAMACAVGPELRGDVACNEVTDVKPGGPRVRSASIGSRERAVRPDGRRIDAKTPPAFYLKVPEPAK